MARNSFGGFYQPGKPLPCNVKDEIIALFNAGLGVSEISLNTKVTIGSNLQSGLLKPRERLPAIASLCHLNFILLSFDIVLNLFARLFKGIMVIFHRRWRDEQLGLLAARTLCWNFPDIIFLHAVHLNWKIKRCTLHHLLLLLHTFQEIWRQFSSWMQLTGIPILTKLKLRGSSSPTSWTISGLISWSVWVFLEVFAWLGDAASTDAGFAVLWLVAVFYLFVGYIFTLYS